jgi:WD40 repeat protein
VRYLILKGRILISASDDNEIRIWDLQKAVCLFQLKNGKEITSLCSGNNYDIYVGCKDGTIRKFVIPQEKQYEKIFEEEYSEQSSFSG